MTGPNDLELACRLVEAVHAQNTRASSKRTYHLVISLHPEDRSLDTKEIRHVVENLVNTLGFSGHQYIVARHDDKDHEHVHVAINKIHPETFRIHSPAWDHQKLFTAGRALELELGLTPLRSRARDREKLPERAADCEAHQGIHSFAQWARKKLGPALPRSLWKEYEQSLDQARRERRHAWTGYRHMASKERQRLKGKYRRQRALVAALPVFGADRKRLSQQLSLRQAIDSRALKQQLSRQRKAIHNTTHPGTWRHFVASRA